MPSSRCRQPSNRRDLRSTLGYSMAHSRATVLHPLIALKICHNPQQSVIIICMGIHVYLAIITEHVSEADWQRIYEKARRVTKQWTPRPLSSAWREIGAVRVAQYTREIEGTSGLHIVGDAETLTTGESFIFPVALGDRMPRCDQPGSPAMSGHECYCIARLSRRYTSRRCRQLNLLAGAAT